jgi:hypothetical protein
MKTRIAQLVTRSVAGAGLAAALAFGGGFDRLDAHHADADNYFVQHPGPLGGRTDVDAHDPYAPVDLGGTSLATDGVVNARARTGESAASAAPSYEWSSSPRLPSQPY